MDVKETVLDRITKALGNYLSAYANKNVLNDLCDKVEEIQKIKDNLENTKKLLEKEDPQMAATLGSFIIKKEEQIDRLMKSKIPELFPKPEIIYADDYERHSGECGMPDYFKLKKSAKSAYQSKQYGRNLSDVLKDVLEDDPIEELEEAPKKKENARKTTTYSSYSSGGCGTPPHIYGGC